MSGDGTFIVIGTTAPDLGVVAVLTDRVIEEWGNGIDVRGNEDGCPAARAGIGKDIEAGCLFRVRGEGGLDLGFNGEVEGA